jgi:hypothetical protein
MVSGTVELSELASAGVGFQKDSLRSTGSWDVVSLPFKAIDPRANSVM